MHTGKIGERRGERASEERQVGLKVKVAGKKRRKEKKQTNSYNRCKESSVFYVQTVVPVSDVPSDLKIITA